jgi:tetratricopeptide (TPR) repeat protein
MTNVRPGHRHIALLILLAAAAALFACGLPGGFLLDDFPNLSGLEEAKASLLRAAIFVVNTPSGFPGRPISYLSFLLQYASWPGDPQAFKLVNIALHLLNGALVYAVVSRLLALAGDKQAIPAALIATMVWLIHPIQLSTVLYVVQRMNELAALFCLLGFIAYLKGRALAGNGREARGYAWMSAAVALGTPLSILAKENGALLPLFIAVMEFTLLAGVGRPARWTAWAAAFLALPPLALTAYLALSPHTMAGYAVRSFGMADRLYTEAGILWDYLAKMALPRPRAFGIYFDDYPVAAPPWASLSTALAIGGWCVALGGALAWRRKLPVVAFAILWFLAGHLLESTVIPLELYFEHRNYLPLLGPAVALAWAAIRLWQSASSMQVRRLYAALGACGVLALFAVSWVEARAWSDPIRQTVLWANERPTSPRAQYELGNAYLQVGRYAEASEVFVRAQALVPGEPQFFLARFVIGCFASYVPLPKTAEVAHTLATVVLQPVMVNLLDTLVSRKEDGRCPRIELEDARTLVDAFLANPQTERSYKAVGLHMKGRIEALRGNLDGAVRSLEAADAISPNMMSVQLQVTWLLSADLYDDALRAVVRGRNDPRWHRWQRMLFAGFFTAWERQVREVALRHGVTLQDIK